MYSNYTLKDIKEILTRFNGGNLKSYELPPTPQNLTQLNAPRFEQEHVFDELLVSPTEAINQSNEQQEAVFITVVGSVLPDVTCVDRQGYDTVSEAEVSPGQFQPQQR